MGSSAPKKIAPDGRQWPEVSDFVARFCTTCENRTRNACDSGAVWDWVLIRTRWSGVVRAVRAVAAARPTDWTSRMPDSEARDRALGESQAPKSFYRRGRRGLGRAGQPASHRRRPFRRPPPLARPAAAAASESADSS